MAHVAEPARNRRPGGRPTRPAAAAVALLGAMLVLAGCLGPTQPDPSRTAPFGNLDAITAEGLGIRVSGWVADPNTRGPIVVKVGSEGRVYDVVANLPRADVGAAFPSVGPDHGFNFWFPDLPPGLHGICVWAENVGAGSQDRLLGCKNLTVKGGADPIGAVDAVDAPGPNRARVSGWALDADTTDSVEVSISVDGTFVTRQPATGFRPDVGAAFGMGSNKGYSIEFPADPGNRLVCVVAINQRWGQDRLIGCGRTDVLPPPADHRPSGAVTRVTPGAATVALAGTATDPDGSSGLQARVSVEGGPSRTVSVGGGVFNASFTGLLAGPRRICVTLLDVPAPPGANVVSGNRDLPCSTAVIGGAIAVGTGGSPSSSAPVGPAPSNPLARIDRDAGISVKLRDGSLLWLFGDSSEVDVNGNLRYFVNNTAAWAAPGSLTVTRDAVSGGAPVQFAGAQDATWTCPADKPNKARWPLSAVARPVGATDRVTVFMANVCLGGFLQIEDRGVSVFEWTYDRNSPPDGVAVTGTLVSDRLFTEAEPAYGTAAVLDDAGRINAYACDRPADGSGLPQQYGPCRVARVPAGSVANRGTWTYWDGASWVPAIASAAPMALPDGVGGYTAPVSSMTINRDEIHGVYVMAYSPWPGFVDRIYVRVATSPQGPWTAPVEVLLPGCSDTVGGATYYCYAGTSQPSLSAPDQPGAPGLLGLGYYDQLVEVGPSRGQYLTIQVPFTVVIAP